MAATFLCVYSREVGGSGCCRKSSLRWIVDCAALCGSSHALAAKGTRVFVTVNSPYPAMPVGIVRNNLI